jgi:DNA-binding XRE family transcriptional regulator
MSRTAAPPSAAGGDGGGLYNRIAVLRTERGMSRQDLADAVNVNYQTVGYLERGDYNPSLELAFRLSELFGVPIEAIFSRNPFRPMSEELYNRLPATGTDSAR